MNRNDYPPAFVLWAEENIECIEKALHMKHIEWLEDGPKVIDGTTEPLRNEGVYCVQCEKYLSGEFTDFEDGVELAGIAWDHWIDAHWDGDDDDDLR